MEYLAAAEQERFMDDEGGPAATPPPHRKSARPSLAHRLRATTAVMTARASMDVRELVRSGQSRVRKGAVML